MLNPPCLCALASPPRDLQAQEDKDEADQDEQDGNQVKIQVSLSLGRKQTLDDIDWPLQEATVWVGHWVQAGGWVGRLLLPQSGMDLLNLTPGK